jgi:hypothetical protein
MHLKVLELFLLLFLLLLLSECVWEGLCFWPDLRYEKKQCHCPK